VVTVQYTVDVQFAFHGFALIAMMIFSNDIYQSAQPDSRKSKPLSSFAKEGAAAAAGVLLPLG
jgi:hypothetical protein